PWARGSRGISVTRRPSRVVRAGRRAGEVSTRALLGIAPSDDFWSHIYQLPFSGAAGAEGEPARWLDTIVHQAGLNTVHCEIRSVTIRSEAPMFSAPSSKPQTP